MRAHTHTLTYTRTKKTRKCSTHTYTLTHTHTQRYTQADKHIDWGNNKLLLHKLYFVFCYNNKGVHHPSRLVCSTKKGWIYLSSLCYLGDARALLVRGNRAYRLSKDHTPSNSKERDRIIREGKLFSCDTVLYISSKYLMVCLSDKSTGLNTKRLWLVCAVTFTPSSQSLVVGSVFCPSNETESIHMHHRFNSSRKSCQSRIL